MSSFGSIGTIEYLAARARRAAEVSKRRNAEANDAYDFRYFGDEDGRHVARCLFGQNGGVPCARDYVLDADSEPDDTAMYEGTGIGVLYGLPDTDHLAYDLAGWTLLRRKRRPEEENR